MTMRLFTNSNNINSLKVQIAGELAGQPLQIVGVAPNGNNIYVFMYDYIVNISLEGNKFFLFFFNKSRTKQPKIKQHKN